MKTPDRQGRILGPHEAPTHGPPPTGRSWEGSSSSGPAEGRGSSRAWLGAHQLGRECSDAGKEVQVTPTQSSTWTPGPRGQGSTPKTPPPTRPLHPHLPLPPPPQLQPLWTPLPQMGEPGPVLTHVPAPLLPIQCTPRLGNLETLWGCPKIRSVAPGGMQGPRSATMLAGRALHTSDNLCPASGLGLLRPSWAFSRGPSLPQPCTQG